MRAVESGYHGGDAHTASYMMSSHTEQNKRSKQKGKKKCPRTDLNYGPLHYKCNALPLSYKGTFMGKSR